MTKLYLFNKPAIYHPVTLLVMKIEWKNGKQKIMKCEETTSLGTLGSGHKL